TQLPPGRAFPGRPEDARVHIVHPYCRDRAERLSGTTQRLSADLSPGSPCPLDSTPWTFASLPPLLRSRSRARPSRPWRRRGEAHSLAGQSRRDVLKMGELLKRPEAFLDLFVIQDSQTVKTKGFYGKRGHDASKDDRLFEGVDRPVPCCRQIAQKAAGKGVAGPCRIAYVFQRDGGGAKHLLLIEHEHPVLAPFDDEVLRPPCQNVLRNLHQIGIVAQRSRLAVIDDEDIHLLQHTPQRVSLTVNPKIHRVTGHERRARELLQDVQL